MLTEQEVSSRRHVAVVNQAPVRKFVGVDDLIGRQIVLKDVGTIPDPVNDSSFTIVGVTSAAKNQGIQEAVIPEVFIPYSLTGFYERGILVRTAADPLALQNSVRPNRTIR